MSTRRFKDETSLLKKKKRKTLKNFQDDFANCFFVYEQKQKLLCRQFPNIVSSH